MPSAEIEFGSIEHIKELDIILDSYCDLLWKLTPSVMTGRAEDICSLFLSSCETGKAISILGKHGLLVNECYMLSRSFSEKIINAVYLLICDDEEFDSYLGYSLQKSFRVMNKDLAFGLNINNEELDSESEESNEEIIKKALFKFAEEHPRLKKALERYTSKKGKEITRWTKKSISQRVEVIKSTTKIDTRFMEMAKESLYENASEALHGTTFGTVFHLGIYKFKKETSSKEMYIENARHNLTMILTCCAGLSYTLILNLEPFCNDKDIFIEAKTLKTKLTKLQEKIQH